MAAPNPEASSSTGPWSGSRSTPNGAPVPPPGRWWSLAGQDESGGFHRSIVKVTNPDRYGLVVGDYFV